MANITDLDVQIVVPIHDPSRFFERMVTAVLGEEGPDLRVGVIAVLHNLGVDEDKEVRRRLRIVEKTPGSLRFLTVRDGIPSPAGPLNAGLESAEAEWVGVAGSDDDLDHGALASWVIQGMRRNADIVLAPILDTDGTLAPTPPVRVGGKISRTRRPIADRLYYRSSPVGIFRRTHLQRSQARMTVHAQTGEDIAFMARLLSNGGQRKSPRVIVADPRQGAYRIVDDAPSRASTKRKAIEDQLCGVRGALSSSTMSILTTQQQRALGTKILRRDLIEILSQRVEWGDITDATESLAEIVEQIQKIGNCEGYLAKSEMNLLREGTSPTATLESIKEALQQARQYRSFSSLLAHDWRLTFSRDAPLRYRFASKFAAACYRRRYELR
ncbi:glycosyltransferase family 2 protein [Actinomycetaceae bacterium WB03_NA08]|uniref:Glycosyltransferase family 2 protein n=1 Tax=Scrofimicrobium canadense TaxID=2652290 RepID=A0A6N7W2E9_9ACTO|nr:glycosyltransferase family A protein [Scrofimicrobium canadense]MSS83465.1 glycosyltransferase family 2 protein [Scrofimicrobium canadense]